MMDDLARRLDTIRRVIRGRKLDALLVGEPQNRRYLSGYTALDHSIAESSGLLLIPAAGRPLLLTDSRFELVAGREAPGFDVKLYPAGLVKLLARLLPELSIRRLGFESHYMLHASAEKLERVLGKKGIELIATTGLVEKLRLIKAEPELGLIRRAVLLNEQVFQEVFATLKPGMTEKQVARALERTMLEQGAERPSFETIVAGGPNGAMPHAVPTDRPLQPGEPIIIDMGLVLDGYCADMTRTVFLGEPDPVAVELVRLVRRAQQAGMAAIRAGIRASQVDRAARQVIADAGHGPRFGHGLGHGVGLAVHEGPSLNRRNHKQLRAGMVVTVEPGVYIPDWGGIRLENMVVVTDDGCENLNGDTTFLDI